MPKKLKPDSQDTNEALVQELKRISGCLELMNESNHRIEGLLRILTEPVLLSSLPGIFKDGKQIRAYELSDGVNSTRDIARLVGVDQKTISTWWRTWEENYGVVEKVGVRGQFRKRYTLHDVLARCSQQK